MRIWKPVASDVRLAIRRLGEAPGFSAVCILTLALGIGGNTAVFTLIDRVVLEPLPVPRPSELYRVGDTDACCVNSGLMGSFSLFSYDLYRHLREAAPEFRQLAAFQANTRSITIGRAESGLPPETLVGAFVSGNYFQMFELAPAAGRLLQPSDDQAGAEATAVISYRAWRARYQSRADVVGSAVTLNGVPATIVGVAPQGFFGEMLRPESPEIWVPLSAEPGLQPASRLIEQRASHWLYAMGRLDPNVNVAALSARLSGALRAWITANLDVSADERARIPQQRINIIPAAGGVNNLRDDAGPSLKLLQALAAALLLIACANLASLLLARGIARRTETAVRAALGASRARIASQFLVESVVLAAIGGLLGLALSFAGARAIIELAFRGASHVPVDPAPSLLVVGFATVVSLVTGAVFGAAPAIFASRSEPIEALRGAGRNAGDRGGRLRQSLIALQIALSLVLVTCAGLLGRSLQELETQDFGFQVEGRYVVNLAPSFAMVPADQMESTYVRLRERLRTIPGVVHAGYSLYAPMSGDNWSSGITVDGTSPTERVQASWNRVSPGYFEAIGTPLLRGRVLDERDRPGAPLVTVVSQTFASRFFGDGDPIGRRMGFRTSSGEVTREFEIVGVVGDAKYQDGRAAAYATYFLPFLQRRSVARVPNQPTAVQLDRSHYAQAIELHTTGPTPALEREVRRALAQVDPRLTVRTIVSMDEQIARAFNLERLIARLTMAFGGTALILACLGLHGVTAYSVSRRTREIGIRMAVGASRLRVLRTVVGSALLQLAIGIAIGLPAALAAGRLLRARLFGISGHDPVILSAALIVLGCSALIAAWIPGHRAATMDPVTALRTE
jgi:macrolide transport system ATP-binding/permease protein